MTRIDNSKVILEGVYADVTVLVPAHTTYAVGTVLGRNANGKLTAFSSSVANSTPLYILAQAITNDGGNADEFELVRALDSGVVDARKLYFATEGDATKTSVLDGLKTNNIRLVNVDALIEESNLAN